MHKSLAFGVVALVSGNAYALDPLWAPGVAYTSGDHATYGVSPPNVAYQCRQSHTSQIGWEPPKVHSLWEKPTPPNCFGWSTQTKYAVGSLVVYGPATYKCLQAHNSEDNWTPPNTPALWSVVSSSSCSTGTETTFEQAYNNPPHYSGLSVTTNSSIISAYFAQANRKIRADMAFTSPSAFTLGFFVESGEFWQRFGTATESGASFDTTFMSSIGLQKNSMIMALAEVMSSDAVVTAVWGNATTPGCPNTADGLHKSIYSIAGATMNSISSYFYANFIEQKVWLGLGDRCAIEAACRAELQCAKVGSAFGGIAACDATKGSGTKGNRCSRDTLNMKVVCQEFDEKGRLVSESVVSCYGN
jgi:hypothetical protein